MEVFKTKNKTKTKKPQNQPKNPPKSKPKKTNQKKESKEKNPKTQTNKKPNSKNPTRTTEIRHRGRGVCVCDYMNATPCTYRRELSVTKPLKCDQESSMPFPSWSLKRVIPSKQQVWTTGVFPNSWPAPQSRKGQAIKEEVKSLLSPARFPHSALAAPAGFKSPLCKAVSQLREESAHFLQARQGARSLSSLWCWCCWALSPRTSDSQRVTESDFERRH